MSEPTQHRRLLPQGFPLPAESSNDGKDSLCGQEAHAVLRDLVVIQPPREADNLNHATRL